MGHAHLYSLRYDLFIKKKQFYKLTPIWQIPQKHLITSVKLAAALILLHKVCISEGYICSTQQAELRTAATALIPWQYTQKPHITVSACLCRTPCGYEGCLHRSFCMIRGSFCHCRVQITDTFPGLAYSVHFTFCQLGTSLCAHLLAQTCSVPHTCLFFPLLSGFLRPAQEKDCTRTLKAIL